MRYLYKQLKKHLGEADAAIEYCELIFRYYESNPIPLDILSERYGIKVNDVSQEKACKRQ